MKPTDLLTPSGVAELRGCSDALVRVAIARGDLPATPLYGRHGKVNVYAVRVADARRWTPNPVGRPLGS